MHFPILILAEGKREEQGGQSADRPKYAIRQLRRPTSELGNCAVSPSGVARFRGERVRALEWNWWGG